jgi:hypothetical protein
MLCPNGAFRYVDLRCRVVPVAEPEDVRQPHATFGAARSFGLDDEEIWQAVNEVCERTPNELRAEDLEELIVALATRIQVRWG